MFDWLKELISGIGESIAQAFAGLGEQISGSIWKTMLGWIYETVYGAAADFFTKMGNMGAEIFDLQWVEATIRLFTLFGWGLFVAGVVVAVFDLAIEYQNGRASVKSTMLNILKGFFACSLIGVVPVELYKFCISLQNTFAGELTRLFSDGKVVDISEQSLQILLEKFSPSAIATSRIIQYPDFNRVRVLRRESVFPKHQTRRHFIGSDVGRGVVYVLRAARVRGRVCASG